MTFAEEHEGGPVDGPDAGGTSQGEPGGQGSGTGDDGARERGGDPDQKSSSNEKADSVADVDGPPASKGNV